MNAVLPSEAIVNPLLNAAALARARIDAKQRTVASVIARMPCNAMNQSPAQSVRAVPASTRFAAPVRRARRRVSV